MISRETMFAESLQRVRRMAREQGNCIREEQVREEFSELDLTDSQLQMVFEYLEKHGVGMGEPENPEAYLTEEERNYLQMYLEALPVYSESERLAWVTGAAAGDRDAAQRLTEACLREVADIARLYTGQGVLLEDLIGEGNAALYAGVEMLGKGQKDFGGEDLFRIEGKLAGYIMDAMEELIRDNADQERIDRTIEEKVNQVADRARELAEELRRKVTPEELVQETGMSPKLIQDAMRMSGYKIEDIEYAEDRL